MTPEQCNEIKKLFKLQEVLTRTLEYNDFLLEAKENFNNSKTSNGSKPPPNNSLINAEIHYGMLKGDTCVDAAKQPCLDQYNSIIENFNENVYGINSAIKEISHIDNEIKIKYEKILVIYRKLTKNLLEEKLKNVNNKIKEI